MVQVRRIRYVRVTTLVVKTHNYNSDQYAMGPVIYTRSVSVSSFAISRARRTVSFSIFGQTMKQLIRPVASNA